MIIDSETNFVYFSELLRQKPRYMAFHQKLSQLLDRLGIAYDYLPETRDIWCRDYMPLQVSQDRYVGFSYDPDYLKGERWQHLRTYSGLVYEPMEMKTEKSAIILDGGNVIRWKDKVILTDKIVSENAHQFTKTQLIRRLEEVFRVDHIILIPRYPEDIFGHADGMLRFIDGQTLLIDGFLKSKESGIGDQLLSVLKEHHLEAIPLDFDVPVQSRHNWGYLNFLQLENLLLLPQFGIAEDQQALQQISALFPEAARKDQVHTIDAQELIRDGGALNCISWNIRI